MKSTGSDTQLTHREQIILMAIAGGAVYGLEIQKAILECSDRGYEVPFGTLYPVLRILEEKGVVESAWEHSDRVGTRRRLYQCTDTGKDAISNILSFQHRLLSWQNGAIATG